DRGRCHRRSQAERGARILPDQRERAAQDVADGKRTQRNSARSWHASAAPAAGEKDRLAGRQLAGRGLAWRWVAGRGLAWRWLAWRWLAGRSLAGLAVARPRRHVCHGCLLVRRHARRFTIGAAQAAWLAAAHTCTNRASAAHGMM